MKHKNNDELLKDFLANGGEIEKLPTIQPERSFRVGSTAKTIPDLKTLAEGEMLYGKKKKVKKKIKKADYTDINMDLIPDHIKKLIKFSGKIKDDKDQT